MVQVIKARPSATAAPHTATPAGTIRVAAYCRVSTDSADQATSYESQVRHYTDYITTHPDWILAGVYADEGLSGTSTAKREQFNRMIADCEAGLIDMVITKSISRWARNTVDSLKHIRKLKALGIPILFEKENINTMDARGEVLITIMSSIAQQESDSISKNVRMGIQYQMQQGITHLNTTRFLGYKRGPDGTLVIEPAEADIIRRIYREYLEGFSPAVIASHLTKDGIPTPAHKSHWFQSTVISILQNEKYAGELLMQKYYVADFLTHRVRKNDGQLPQYYVENAHEPIVPKEIFYQVQGEIQRRSALKDEPERIRYGSANALAGRLICGRCGRTLKCYTHPDGLTDYRCRQRAYNKRSITKENEPSCPCRCVSERTAKRVILTAFNELQGYGDELIRMFGAVYNGEIKQIDAYYDRIQREEKKLNSRLDELTELTADDNKGNAATGNGSSMAAGVVVDSGTSAAGGCDERCYDHCDDESAFIKQQLADLEVESTRLVLDRAEAANTAVQIKLLQELVEAMTRIQASAPADASSPACSEYCDFFNRTRYSFDDSIFSDDGTIIAFQNSMIIRYLDAVIVLDDWYEVRFKCGLRVRVDG